MTERNLVLVVGAGMMGPGIAACAAMAGHRTVLVDTTARCSEAGLIRALGCIHQLAENGVVDANVARLSQGLLAASADVRPFIDNAGIVIEAVSEKLALKQAVFTELDQMAPPEVLLASNTSGLRITEIAVNTRYPERTVTAHFWFPAHLVPLVEVVMGERTDEAMALQVCEVLRRWGKAPVLVRRDRPGQLANRIYQAMIREASNIVQQGIASAEDVDTALKMGLGLRLPAWGVLEHVDAVGLDLVLSTQTTVLPEIENVPGPTQILRDLVAGGHLGHKTGAGFYDWSARDMAELSAGRDRFIMAALRILRDVDGDPCVEK